MTSDPQNPIQNRASEQTVTATLNVSAQNLTTGVQPHPCDYPTPAVLDSADCFIWNQDAAAVDNYRAMGERLARCGDLFRNPGYGDGLLLTSVSTNGEPKTIRKGAELAPLLIDRVRVQVLKDGKSKGSHIPTKDLTTMLASEIFLQAFAPVDAVEKRSRYLPDFTLTQPGYNDGSPGHRILHIGKQAVVTDALEAIHTFLDVMEFATKADRTNAVAAALTVLLRDYWLGAKPLILATSTKSHGGKDTIISFACGVTRSVSISYQSTDWALERSFVGAVKHQTEAGVVVLDNARLTQGVKNIASAFMERFLTDAQPMLFSTGTGKAVRRRNNLVLALSTNNGSLSEDLMNRALPIQLNPVGDVASRQSPIGNPKMEYLPTNRERIEAELHGMIQRWINQGRPLDTGVRHPFSEWAQVVGGILRANGFTDFLGNYSMRKTVDDPLRQALGLLGVEQPDSWLSPADWAKLAVDLSVARTLIPDPDRHSDKGCERGMGLTLSKHEKETFCVETEDEKMTLRLEKARQRFQRGGEASTRYRFVLLLREALVDEGNGGMPDEGRQAVEGIAEDEEGYEAVA